MFFAGGGKNPASFFIAGWEMAMFANLFPEISRLVFPGLLRRVFCRTVADDMDFLFLPDLEEAGMPFASILKALLKALPRFTQRCGAEK
ncbi:MAG TPA: hypothetical protein DD422_02970 [Akkermansia sp.]|nr:hypothetical protein [Akkermansia sp.]